MLKEELILRAAYVFIFGFTSSLSHGAFAKLVAVNESRAEIGRSIASEQGTNLNLKQLSSIQAKYNQLGKLKNLKPLLQNSLGKQDQLFLKNQDQEINLPKIRILDGELHLGSKEGVVKVTVIELRQGKFEINNHIWQLSQPLRFKDDLTKIDQILRKAHVLGTDSSNPTDIQQNAMAIYGFGFLATFQSGLGN